MSLEHKALLAGYLASLHALLDAQAKSGYLTPSATLAKEFVLKWEELKGLIKAENENV